jgi:hypothetical protein
MKKLISIFLGLLVIAGCTKEEPVAEVTFTINIIGFNITSDEFGSLKSIQADIFSDFDHKFSGGELNFTTSSEVPYIFDKKDYSIEGFTITLPVGTYQLSGFGGTASYAGTAGMAFNIPVQEIIIEPTTISIDVTVTPECALFLVADQFDQVKEAFIAGASRPPSWPFFEDGIYKYTYFEPTTGFVAHIVRLDDTELKIYTTNLQKGYVYKIEITDGSSGMGLNINPTFEDAEIVIW